MLLQRQSQHLSLNSKLDYNRLIDYVATTEHISVPDCSNIFILSGMRRHVVGGNGSMSMTTLPSGIVYIVVLSI